MPTRFPLVITCAFGLESVVKRELSQLGYAARGISPGRLRIDDADADAIVRCNLWLRAADRVLIEMARFAALDFDALFETTRDLPWDAWITPDGAIPVVGRSLQSQLSSVPACQRAVKKAIVEKLQAALPGRSLPETGATFKVEVALLKDEATLTLDTTGPSLHKRGYREAPVAAPLKETLAAALVMLSVWEPGRPLLDPFCGSGTIVIEAARIARGIAPGGDRSFAAEEWPACPASLWREARQAAADQIQPPLPERLIGADRDFRVLRHARAGAAAAGVIDDVHFDEREFSRTSSKRQYGCVITNPPYGERLGQAAETQELYRTFPEVLRKLETWSFFVLTNEPTFEAIVERSADRRRKLYNGRIECTYFQFLGPKPPQLRAKATTSDMETDQTPAPREPESQPRRRESRPATKQSPVFGALGEKAQEQAELFARRLSKRARHFRRWPTRQGIHCYRLYERDIPEIPLIVDRYEDHLHLVEYDRPHERSRGEHASWLDLMADTAAKTLEIPRRQVFFKRKQRQRGTLQHEKQDQEGYELIVREQDLRFVVNLSDYVDTGLFLDHRITRQMVREEAAGKRVLNLFAYTGAFTVYAAAGDAAETTTVDWSAAYVKWAERNLELNKLSGQQHKFLREDAREYLLSLPEIPLFDLVILDPPTFSNSKRTDEVWDVQRDHVELINAVLRRMTSQGVLYFSTNFRKFSLDESQLETERVFEISKQTVPEDFRNRRIHRCWRIFPN